MCAPFLVVVPAREPLAVEPGEPVGGVAETVLGGDAELARRAAEVAQAFVLLPGQVGELVRGEQAQDLVAHHSSSLSRAFSAFRDRLSRVLTASTSTQRIPAISAVE
ncbi:hypothetical protein GCM10010470_12810 [Saccharopolyspora taberi]|uniref:Uncharacterized protein n=1 Tax=Saccharopolyspora taberi TaxID=60895 RepID=A0ABN3V7A3_9PSEU